MLQALSAFLFQDPGYLNDADRADEVVRLASTLAGSVDSPREKDLYRRIGAKYSRRATEFRWKAIPMGLINHWKAVLSGVAERPYDLININNIDYIADFGTLETRDRLEADLKRIQDRLAPVGPD